MIAGTFLAMCAGASLSFASSLVRMRYPNSQKALGMSWLGFFLTWGTPVAVGLYAIS